MLGKDSKRPNTTLPLLRRNRDRKSLGLTFRPQTSAQKPTPGDTVGRSSLPIDLSAVPVQLKEKLESFRSYRALPKVVEKNKYEQKPNEPHVDYFLTLEKEKVSPRAWGVLRKSYCGGDIVASHYYLGRQCAHALAHSLDNIDDVEKVLLQGNKLSSDSSVKILKRLHSKNTRELNMSDNQLGPVGIVEVADIVSSTKTVIKKLHLENCGLGLRQIDALCQALGNNNTVKELSLARNHLGDSAAASLGEMVESNRDIVRLDLHWNNLRAPGALKLMEGLKLNSKLRELDLSWNSLAQGDTAAMGRAISKWLLLDTHLRHLDISFNYIPAEMWELANEGLRDNHTLVGLHVLGNYCEIDSRGFVTPCLHCEKTMNALISPRILKGKPSKGAKCWVCEKWVEVTITVEDASVLPPIFIHFEFEGFQAEMMRTEGWRHSVTRVVPPGKPRFFVSTLQGPFRIQDMDIAPVRLHPTVSYYLGSSVDVDLTELHYLTAAFPTYTAKQCPASEPRIPSSKYTPPSLARPKTPWSLPISLFKSYRFATDRMIAECFEADWTASRIPKIIKDPEVLESCKAKLKTAYRAIREAYKYFSGVDSGSAVFSIGQNVFTDIMNRCDMIDSSFGLSDLDLVLTNTNYNEVRNNPLNPSNALVRFEFLEVIVRIANDKYIRTKVTSSFEDAIDMTLCRLLPFYRNYNSEEWRWKKYICEAVDLVYKAYKPVLDAVYAKFSGRKSTPGQKPFMSREEWFDLCTQSALINDSFPAREVDLVFSLAMSLRVDELSESKHMEMTFVEFLEALGRACDRACLPPNREGRMTPAALAEQPLKTKIENCMPALMKLCSKAALDALAAQSQKK